MRQTFLPNAAKFFFHLHFGVRTSTISAHQFHLWMGTKPGFKGFLRAVWHYEGFPLVILENLSGIERKTLIIAQLFRELEARGYRGSYASVHDNLVRRLQFGGRKTPADASSKTPPLPTPRQAAFLFLGRPEKLRVEELETLTKLRQLHPEVDLAYDLVQQFAQMLRSRTGELLDPWLAQVQGSNLPELQSFATGVEKDKEAVRAGW